MKEANTMMWYLTGIIIIKDGKLVLGCYNEGAGICQSPFLFYELNHLFNQPFT